jgi:hypothetical protein
MSKSLNPISFPNAMKSRCLIAAPASRPGIVATSLCAQEEISRADSKTKFYPPTGISKGD